MEPVVLYAEFTARPGCETRVEQMICSLAKEVRAEEGNVEFSVYRERDRPRRFFVFERYADDTAFQAHITAEYGLRFNAELAGLIEEPSSQLTWLHVVDD